MQALHHILPAGYRSRIFQRHCNPFPQQAGAHRAAAAVHHIQQRSALLHQRSEDFQIAEGKTVDPYELVAVDAGDAADMVERGVLGHLEVRQDGRCSYGGELHLLYAEALEVCRLELGEQAGPGAGIAEGPLLHRRNAGMAVADVLHQRREFAVRIADYVMLQQHLLRGEVGNQDVDVLAVPLGDLEGARGDVQERHSGLVLLEEAGRQPVVLGAGEQPVVEADAGGHELGDAALYEGLGELRVLQLVADSHLVARLHHFRQIDVDGVVRHSGQFGERPAAAGFAGEHQAEHFAGDDSVLSEGLVEVADAEKHYTVRVLGLDLEILLHQRRQVGFGSCHFRQRYRKTEKKRIFTDSNIAAGPRKGGFRGQMLARSPFGPKKAGFRGQMRFDDGSVHK